MLYIMGAGGGALHILQDTIWLREFEKLEFNPTQITLVEDNPKSSVAFIAGNAYNVISYKDLNYTAGDFGHISAFNIDYKIRLDRDVKLNWINSYSQTYKRFPDIKMGIGVRINWQTYIDGNCQIGNHVKLNSFAFVGHDSSIGYYSYISQHVVLDNHVTIGKSCCIFENSTLLPGICIGDNTIIGAGSVVTKDIPDNVVAYGSPCRVISENKTKQLELV